MFSRIRNSIEYEIEYKRREDRVGNETQERNLRFMIYFWSKKSDIHLVIFTAVGLVTQEERKWSEKCILIYFNSMSAFSYFYNSLSLFLLSERMMC